MKNALISPNEQVSYISDWTPVKNGYSPVITVIADAGRVAEVSDTPFEIAPPLFWLPCSDNVVADKFYCELAAKQVLPKPPDAPYPIVEPVVAGAQTL
jgi:hypothetical protein